MPSNFDFLQTPGWLDFHENAHKVEQFAHIDPSTSVIYARKSLEQLVKWLFENDSSLQTPRKEYLTLNDLMEEPSFKLALPPHILTEINLIRKIGNLAAHNNRRITAEESLKCVKYLFGFAMLVVRAYSETEVAFQPFDESLIPTEGFSPKTGRELDKIREEADGHKIELQRKEIELSQKEAEIKALKTQLEHFTTLKLRNGLMAPPRIVSENETRQLYIDTLLQEVGWDLQAPNVIEYTLADGNRADYALWDDNGKPLAVVEAKKTDRSAQDGQQQAKLYADTLEQTFGQRPFIFYTNGFENWFWDDAYYPPRRVQGFYRKADLQRLLQRRTLRTELRHLPANKDIIDRAYQKEAVRRVAEALDLRHRKVLLVMATGTGKTRVAAALTDLLTKADWQKRMLFLADRNALLTQAKKAFNRYLPHLSGIDLTEEEDDGAARLVFSTYPTILNRIDEDFRNGQRFYSAGHFDVIVIDEAHRSIYEKYRSIFDYFDALLIGLTATPKAETDRDTYRFFDLPQHEPTFAYELDDAVKQGFLVPPKAFELPLKFPRAGIRYEDLSEEEKGEYEEKFYDPDTGDVPGEITPAAINNWLFNNDTVDTVLDYLMNHGLTVEGGDTLGKTIVFARNHKHALFIEARFNLLYPHLKGDFLQIVDNHSKDPQRQIDDFKVPGKYPQIAVSVDMLDTGIDVPEILNLVFFKPVYSAAKFWQMIGRGTRLCPDVFGLGKDKACFYIFDVCGNFEFFSLKPEGNLSARSYSLKQQLFNGRAELAFLIQQQEDAAHRPLADSLAAYLCGQVRALNTQQISVRDKLRYVEYYQGEAVWKSLGKGDLDALRQHVAPLVFEEETDEAAKRFDYLILRLQNALLQQNNRLAGLCEDLRDVAKELLRKVNVAAIQAEAETLKTLLTEAFWQGVTVTGLETIRLRLRDLIGLLDRQSRSRLEYTDFTDEMTDAVKVHDKIGRYSNLENYYHKVTELIRKHGDHLTLRKLHLNQPISSSELRLLNDLLFAESGIETQEEFDKTIGAVPLGVFVRSILGMDAKAARQALGEFLDNGSLTANQMAFVNKIVECLTRQGTVPTTMLFETPFTDLHDQGVFGLFDTVRATRLIAILKEVERKALA